MKNANAALVTLINSGRAFSKANLYTWTFIDGTVLRVTDADISLTANGFSFLSCAPAMERGKTTLSIGVDVDSIEITILPAPTDSVTGLSWQAASRLGYLDGAQVLVECAYIQTWPTVIGTLHVFQGQASDVKPERTSIVVEVKSATELLAQPFPRNLYQSVCLHTVYDPGCGVTKASYTAASTVSASPAPTFTSFQSGLTQAAGYFDQGVVKFTSGANIGLTRTVKSYTPATGFTFALPLPSPPVSGDTFSVFAGCDKTLATCRTKFNNAQKFRGFPWIPNPETATPPIAATTTKSGK